MEVLVGILRIKRPIIVSNFYTMHLFVFPGGGLPLLNSSIFGLTITWFKILVTAVFRLISFILYCHGPSLIGESLSVIVNLQICFWSTVKIKGKWHLKPNANFSLSWLFSAWRKTIQIREII